MQNINVKNLSVDNKKFFTYWLQFLKPYHKLRNKEIEMLALFLVKRHELSKKVKDEDLVDKMLFDKDVKAEIREEMQYTTYQVFNNMMTSLRRKGAIINNRINKGLIPNYDEKTKNFKLIFNFNIKNETRYSAEKNS